MLVCILLYGIMCSTAMSIILSQHIALMMCSYSVIRQMCHARYTSDANDQVLFILELMMLRRGILYVADVSKHDITETII